MKVCPQCVPPNLVRTGFIVKPRMSGDALRNIFLVGIFIDAESDTQADAEEKTNQDNGKPSLDGGNIG